MTLDPRRDFEELAHAATNCRECFVRHEVSAPDIDVAQPRWIGRAFWEQQSFRVAISMINPGQSGATPQAMEYRGRIRAFRDGEVPLQPILDRQREHWGRSGGRFTNFYLEGLGLDLDKIALANVAWCGTRDNKYPNKMLNRCFDRDTGPLLALLTPTVVLLSGKPTHTFAQRILRLLPHARVIPLMHYRHRKGHQAEQAEFARVRALLGSALPAAAG